MRKLQAFFHHVKPKRILDVATGNGSFIHLVTRMYDDYEYIVGVDTSKKGIDSANASFENDRIHFLEKDVFDMVDEQFDVILLSNSLHHFDDLHKLFKQFEKLLSPNGFIVVNEMMKDHLSKAQKSHMKLHHFAAEIDRHLGRYHDETMTSKEILENIQAVTSKRIIDAWDMVYPIEQGTSDEELKSIDQTINRLVDKLEDESFKNQMHLKAEKMKKYIHKRGFELATQMLLIMGERV